MDTNRTVAILAVGLLLATAGCTQLITGDAKFTASTGTVEEYEALGYEQDRTEWRNITETVEVGGQERDVTVANHVQVFLNRDENDDPVSGMALITSPEVEVATQAANPVGEWSNERVLEEFSGEFSEYGSIDNVEERDTTAGEFVGVETTYTTFEATAQSDEGESRNIIITVTKVQEGGDYVIGIGVHDRGDEQNAEAVEELFENVEH